MEYLSQILGFITAGGVATLVSVRYIRKSTKLDYADRAIKFLEDQNEKMIRRFEIMEKRIDELELLSCEKADCKIRVTSLR